MTNAGSLGDFGDYIGIDSLQITNAVPEPSTWVLCGLSVAALGLGIHRKRTRTVRLPD